MACLPEKSPPNRAHHAGPTPRTAHMHINVHTTEDQAWTCMQILNAISAEQAQDLPQLAGDAADWLDARTESHLIPCLFFNPWPPAIELVGLDLFHGASVQKLDLRSSR